MLWNTNIRTIVPGITPENECEKSADFSKLLENFFFKIRIKNVIKILFNTNIFFEIFKF